MIERTFYHYRACPFKIQVFFPLILADFFNDPIHGHAPHASALPTCPARQTRMPHANPAAKPRPFLAAV